MGWSLFSWLFGEKEESPPEQLVLGAELKCPYGTEHSFLFVLSDDMDINDLPEACVLDREKSVNIMPFGKCQYFQNYECESFMVLDEKWENPEPQAMQINGEEIITTKSTLICMASGKEIKAVTSGQDGIVARRLEKEKEIDEKYPNLRARLMDPNGSLYLDGEMYKEAIRFIEDCVEKRNGELKIADIFDESDLEMVLIRTALGKLIPSCDERRIEKLIDELEIRGTVNDMDNVPGWDPHLLNKAMVEMLKRDSVITAELVETKSFYKWQEKNMQYGDELAEDTMKFAYQALAFYLIMASAPAWGPVGFRDESGTSKQTISNKFPDDNQAGKNFNFTIKDGKINIENGIQEADFVIDMEGNLHIGRGHSYLSGAQDVQAAGTIKVNSQGYIRYITNESGHYQPTVSEALNYPQIFRDCGLNVDNAWIKVSDFITSMSNYVTDKKVFYNGPIQYMP